MHPKSECILSMGKCHFYTFKIILHHLRLLIKVDDTVDNLGGLRTPPCASDRLRAPHMPASVRLHTHPCGPYGNLYDPDNRYSIPYHHRYTPCYIKCNHLSITAEYPYLYSFSLSITNTFSSQTKVNYPRLSLTVNNYNKQHTIYRFQIGYEKGMTSHLIE